MARADRDRWNARWATVGDHPRPDSPLVSLLVPHLPDEGRLLDVAGGGSGDAVTFARKGLDVTVVDVSDVGLGRTRQLAAAAGVAVATVERDLESEPVPPGPWDVIAVANYLQRELFPALLEGLAPGGLLAAVIATRVNLERHDHPGPRFLVEPGELARLAGGLEVVHHTEAWRDSGRHEAHLVARRPPPG